MIINREQLDLLEDFCNEHGYDLREDYSGRGMMGDGCIGFVTSDNGFTVAMNLVDSLKDEDNELLDIFKNAGSRTDSMGYDGIIYFPSISFVPIKE